MLKAVVDRGTILPLEPLPADWEQGQELQVDKVDESRAAVGRVDREAQSGDRIGLLCRLAVCRRERDALAPAWPSLGLAHAATFTAGGSMPDRSSSTAASTVS